MQNTKSSSLADLAELVAGQLLGPADLPIKNAWPLDDAVDGTITMIDSPERFTKLGSSAASAVILPKASPEVGLPAIVVADPHKALETIIRHFRSVPNARPAGVHPTAVVDPSAQLGEEVSIAASVVIESGVTLGSGVVIGPNCTLEQGCQVGERTELAAGVTLYWGTVVGADCRLHAGVVLGADGFGYRQVDGRHEPVPQLGTVELGDCVEVGANTTIDRGVYGPTKIGEGTKIDNLVQIGHNCRIGQHNLICSQVGIAGSTSTGDYVVMAGQVGVRDHVHIGTGAILSAMAGVSNNVADGAVMLGAPATPLRIQKVQMAAVAKLPQLRKQVRAMQRDLDSLLEKGTDSAADRAA